MIDLNSLHFVSSGHTFFRAFFIVVFNRFVLPENPFVWCGVDAYGYVERFLVSKMVICVFKSDPDYYCSSDRSVISAQ
ncbi:hypothetical protein WP8W19C02_P10160 (plasmid) [Enterobacter cloacae]|nr:hypothetical protein WP8W19C02_P10160 [Enterobacter cloacae]